MRWIRDAIRGVHAGRERRRAIRRNLDQVADLELASVRITQGPAGRCFEMPSGMLLTILNEQRPSSGFELVHAQAIVPITTEDAIDFYGWSRP